MEAYGNTLHTVSDTVSDLISTKKSYFSQTSTEVIKSVVLADEPGIISKVNMEFVSKMTS